MTTNTILKNENKQPTYWEMTLRQRQIHDLNTQLKWDKSALQIQENIVSLINMIEENTDPRIDKKIRNIVNLYLQIDSQQPQMKWIKEDEYRFFNISGAKRIQKLISEEWELYHQLRRYISSLYEQLTSGGYKSYFWGWDNFVLIARKIIKIQNYTINEWNNLTQCSYNGKYSIFQQACRKEFANYGYCIY